MPNRLASSPSLYLRKHAHNPIDWWPWIPEALETARAENRPIFLSIGYSSCHWCTVMEGEAFSDPDIADYMNRFFLPIKVDREERPDLDSIYMQSLQLMSGQGGWPLNVFLSPEDLVPFYAGTYFSVDPRYGRPGFLQVLQAVRRYYDEEKSKLSQQKDRLLEALHRLSQTNPGEEISPDLLMSRIPEILPIVSSLSMGHQFPMMPYAQMVLRVARFPEFSRDALNRAKQRGMDLVLGGIFDHVAGGFHRYTVDPTWTVPHFEKMLYDNGQILEFLSDLWASGVKDAAIERAVSLTVDWLEREMTDPLGYFYAAQDADSFAQPQDKEPEEGDFYVWRWSQLESLLSPEAFEALQKAFDLSPEGNFRERPGYLVLQRLSGGELDPVVETVLREVLFLARYGQPSPQPFAPARTATEAKETSWPGRIPPVTDTKMIVAWNGLMISGLARAYQVFGIRRYRDLAVRAAQFILQTQRQEEGLRRVNYDGVVAVAAKSDDYALLIKALLDLHQSSLVNPDPMQPTATDWLSQAQALQAEMDQILWDPEAGGYFLADPLRSADLLLQEKDTQDNATPAANGIALANLVRLTALTGDLSYLSRAEQGLQHFSGFMQKQPRSCPTLLAALDWYHHFLKVSVLSEHVAALQKDPWPTTQFVVEPLTEGMVGMACLGVKCLPPVEQISLLMDQMKRGQILARS